MGPPATVARFYRTLARGEDRVSRRSIGFPLTIGIVLSVLALALGVGWQILVVSDLAPVARGLTGVHWVLLILGGIFFLLIIFGLILLCAWLVREMRFNQRQQAFLDAVTHEMKTPLASLRLYLDTLRARDPAPELRREFLERMEEDLDRLQRTVELLLAAARAEDRARPSRSERVELAPLLERCIDEVRRRHALPEGAIQLKDRGEAAVRGDAEEFGVVFGNLLDNAIKYSPQRVQIEVAVEEGAGRVIVEIADRGIGIPRGELRKVFQRFYRAGLDVQRKAAGLGLGLFIVRSLVLRHGGRVVARSEGIGKGSRFAVTLPAAAPAKATEAAPLHVAHPGR
jgi:signal transduction histidine kinase